MSLADSSRRLAAALTLAARERLELAATDVEEELVHAASALAAMIAIAVLATLALAALASAVVVLLWDRSLLGALLGVAVFFAIAAAVMASRLMRTLAAKPPFMSATLQELDEDARWIEEQGAELKR